MYWLCPWKENIGKPGQEQNNTLIILEIHCLGLVMIQMCLILLLFVNQRDLDNLNINVRHVKFQTNLKAMLESEKYKEIVSKV